MKNIVYSIYVTIIECFILLFVIGFFSKFNTKIKDLSLILLCVGFIPYNVTRLTCNLQNDKKLHIDYSKNYKIEDVKLTYSEYITDEELKEEREKGI